MWPAWTSHGSPRRRASTPSTATASLFTWVVLSPPAASAAAFRPAFADRRGLVVVSVSPQRRRTPRGRSDLRHQAAAAAAHRSRSGSGRGVGPGVQAALDRLCFAGGRHRAGGAAEGRTEAAVDQAMILPSWRAVSTFWRMRRLPDRRRQCSPRGLRRSRSIGCCSAQ